MWGFILGLFGFIWDGVEAALAATVQFLVWAYTALSAAVALLANGLAAAGSALLAGLTRVWNFFELVYQQVIEPVLWKLSEWFSKFLSWLDDTAGAVLRFLQDVRSTLVAWWDTWIRPWLDLIDVTRKILQTLASLGIAWARALDARLASIEQYIEAPFRFILGKLNEMIDVINRVITLDGLIQRVALIGSIVRDYQYAWRAIANPWQAAFDHSTTPTLDDQIKPRTAAEIVSDYGAYVKYGGGNRADMYAKITAFVQKEFGGA